MPNGTEAAHICEGRCQRHNDAPHRTRSA